LDGVAQRPAEVERVFMTYRPTAVVHLAAETRSIDDPLIFIDTNVGGTATLQAVRRRWRNLPQHGSTLTGLSAPMCANGFMWTTTPTNSGLFRATAGLAPRLGTQH
jgi:hypothetical protein